MPWWLRLYRWATPRLYDELAWAYDLVAWVVSLGHWPGWRKEALAALPPAVMRGGRILEVGFGTGDLLVEMARQGVNAVGLDFSPSMHRITARKLRRKGFAVPLVRARTQAMPFDDATYDAIIATFPAEYILSPLTLREARRLLRIADPVTGSEGGVFVIAGLCSETDSLWLRRLAGWIYGPTAATMLAFYQPLAEAAGFTVRTIRDSERRFRLPLLVLEPCDGA